MPVKKTASKEKPGRVTAGECVSQQRPASLLPDRPAGTGATLSTVEDAADVPQPAGAERARVEGQRVRRLEHELKTSRDALQRTRDELETVHAQLRDKTHALEDANHDMTSLLATVDNATLFLGVDRTIQRFTPSATRLFDLVATNVGRTIDHVAARVDDPHLSRDIDQVLQSGAPC